MPRVRAISRVRRDDPRAICARQSLTRAGSDRRVVVDAPELVEQGRCRDDPADPQSGQAVRLRQAARDDRALVSAQDRWRVVPVDLRAAIDLVGQHPGSGPVSDAADSGQFLVGQPGACRVVRIADQNQSSARRDQRREQLEVRPPARRGRVRIADERPGDDAGAERARQAAHLHVVRRHHHHVVARLDKVQERNAVGLGAAVRHLDVIGCGAGIDFARSRAAARACRSSAGSPAPARAPRGARRPSQPLPRREAGARRSPRRSRPRGSPRWTGAVPSRTFRASFREVYREGQRRRRSARSSQTEQRSQRRRNGEDCGLAPRVARRRGCVRTADASTTRAFGVRVCRPDAPTSVPTCGRHPSPRLFSVCPAVFVRSLRLLRPPAALCSSHVAESFRHRSSAGVRDCCRRSNPDARSGPVCCRRERRSCRETGARSRVRLHCSGIARAHVARGAAAQRRSDDGRAREAQVRGHRRRRASRPRATTSSRSSTTPTASRRCAATWRATRSRFVSTTCPSWGTSSTSPSARERHRSPVCGSTSRIAPGPNGKRCSVRSRMRAPARERRSRRRRHESRSRCPHRGAARQCRCRRRAR